MAETFKREAADKPMDFSGERLTSAISGEVAIEHYHRYFLARDFCIGRDVLDIAAGEGYGSALLARVARSVVGVEIDAAVVEAAQTEFVHPNLRYLQGDARAIPLADASIDVVVSFETYEHFAEHETFLAEVRRVLRPGGLIIISTPDRDIYSGPGITPNPYHVREVNRAEFARALSSNFANVHIVQQRALMGSFIAAGRPTEAVRHFEALGQDTIEAAGELKRAPYLIAFASDDDLPTVPHSLYIARSDIDTDAAALRAAQIELSAEQHRHEATRQREANLSGRERELERQKRELESQLAAAISTSDAATRELDRLKHSVSWRASAPLRYLMTNYPGAAGRFRQGGKLIYWAATGQLVQRLKASVAYRYAPSRPETPVPANAVAGISPDGLPVFLDQYLAGRWPGQDLQAIKQAYRFASEYPPGITIDEAALANPGVAGLLAQLKQLASIDETSFRPEVSIIVPVHNALAYTLACLLSLLSQPTQHRFEILIADDVSTDATAAAISSIGGRVRLVRQDRNLGFLLNCNAAAKATRGELLVFLNNDTIALPGWLDQLTAPLEADAQIGLTCSKLLNADGTLQEAGGIFWQDGSAWNYGRGADPRAYPFNFVRDTDYGSGAAIAVPARLWRELGGFDERFAPAYCEDADLAFALRDRGYRTLYIPTSEIIHHEGVSHGRDESKGIKAYQAENLKKLKAKWAKALQAHFPNGQNVAVAAARSRSKTRILVIDHYVPQLDRDAGSRAMNGYLRFLSQSGFHVTFWSENKAYDPHYGPAYQALGIEIVYAWPAQLDFNDWMSRRGADFDYVFVSRPHVAVQFLNSLKKFTAAKLLFIGHDLHGARLRAEREVNPTIGLDQEIEKADRMEEAVWNAVDAIYYPSREEAEYVSRQGVKAPARALPLFLFKDDEIVPRPSVQDLHDPLVPHVMFVGGFRHRPNVDGILWFCREVWPTVQQQHPAARLTIAGSEPPIEVLQLASSSIVVTGYISDDDLEALYRSADVVVAPLRFGAGVKGKVVEALRQGVPIVLTSIAAQGIEDIDKAGTLADEAHSFAHKVIELLRPGEHRAILARKGQDLVRAHYSLDAVRSVFALDIRELADPPATALRAS